ncbi:MAG: ABC transporter permease, partial [Coprococcus sp.]
MLKRLIISDFKRIYQLIIQFIIILAALLSILITVLFTSDKLLYKSKSAPVQVGILMQADSEYSKSAYSFVQNMDSYKSMCSFVEVSSRNEGMELIKSSDINALVIVPDNILTSIINGTNTPIEVVYSGDGSIQTFVLNELFSSTSSFLGTSQAAIYTVLSLCRELNIPDETYEQNSNDINALFLTHVLSRAGLFDRQELNVTGSYTVIEHYSAALILILLSICSIMFMSFLKAYNQSVFNLLKANGLNRFH